MKIIGCDFHTRYQQIAMLDEATGELIERRLEHEDGEAHRFYRNLPRPVRVGVEATGPLHWFERLLAELGHELWIGDSAKIRASEVRRVATHFLFFLPPNGTCAPSTGSILREKTKNVGFYKRRCQEKTLFPWRRGFFPASSPCTFDRGWLL